MDISTGKQNHWLLECTLPALGCVKVVWLSSRWNWVFGLLSKKTKQNTKWFLLAGSLHVSSEPVHVRESGRERVGFAGSPRSSNSTSHPPDPLTTTLVLSLHTPYWWGAFLISLGILLVFLFSSLSPSRPSACPVSSASKDPKVTALWLWVSHWITVWSCLSSASDPSCSPKIQQTPAAPSAAYVIPLE